MWRQLKQRDNEARAKDVMMQVIPWELASDACENTMLFSQQRLVADAPNSKNS
jgi:hypothetical protein